MRLAQESSVMVMMPTKAPFERPQLPSPLPSSVAHTDDEHQATPENLGSTRKRRATHDHDSSTPEEDGDPSKTLYECRFCTMRFVKSQALGGHMNRHRQEREKEQYEHAQQLVSSMAQQQIPRSWTSMAAEINGATGAAAQLARLGTQPLNRPGDSSSSRPQVAPQISFPMMRMPISSSTSSASAAPISDSPSSNFYLPSNSCNSSLQHLQWNVDAGFNAIASAGLPRSSALNAFDSMTGAIRDDFLSGVLQPPPRHDSSFGCQEQSSSVPLLNPRPGTFQDSIPGGRTGLPFPHDHVLRQVASAPLNSTLLDAKPPVRPFMMQHCHNLAQFKQSHVSLPGPRPLGPGSQYHAMSPLGMFSGHSHNSPAFNIHEFTPLQDLDSGMQQYRQQASSGSAASGSAFDHNGGVYAHVKMQPDESDSYNHHCPEAGAAEQTSNAEVPVDGSTRCESMNIADSGDVSGMSAPPRYQSTDLSSGSPEWRTQNNSPSGQANHASPPSHEYCSG